MLVQVLPLPPRARAPRPLNSEATCARPITADRSPARASMLPCSSSMVTTRPTSTPILPNANQTNNVPIIGISADGTSLSCVETSKCDDTEQILDMTQAVSMAPGLSGLYVVVGSSDTAMLSTMSTHTPLAAQISSSWTWSPADPSTDDPYFKKFAAQGQNYFQAAGDSGKYTTSSTDVFPADDGNVTTVGGTDLNTEQARPEHGLLNPPGSMAAAVFSPRTRSQFPPGRCPRLRRRTWAARLTGTLRTFPAMPISPSMFAPIRPPARQMNTAERVLPPPCGPATWR